MKETGPFDRRLRRLRRERAAKRDQRPRYLEQLIDDELLERLAMVNRPFRDALVLGWSTLPDRLRAQGLAVTSADPGFAFAKRCSGVQCDEDRLPFSDDAFDLVLAPGTLDSVNDLPGALTLIRRALRPDGLFLAAFAGAGSLEKLKRAMLAADLETGGAIPRIHPQIDVRAAGDLLLRAGFALPVVDSHAVTIRFSNMPQLVDDLRAAGTTNVLAMACRPLSRAAYAFACAAFLSQADGDGKVSEKLEIIHLSAWSPSPDQPRPAARGSGRQSLTKALRPSPDPK
jgi:SAM-dependent methyltransferase